MHRFAVVVVLVAIAGLAFVGGRSSAGAGAALTGRPVTPRAPLPADETSVINTYEAVRDSVVFIDAVDRVTQRDVFGRTFRREIAGAGSGFVWDTDGHVVTNFHVVRSADFITVTFSDGKTFEADVIGTAPDEDLAVLKIDPGAHALSPVPIGTSHDLRVGQRVLAIGNPFGLDQTLTVGVLSALGRTIESVSGDTIYDVLQTDAAINPGNSGGPLLDSAGRLIGINAAIRSASRSSAGIGFAVPVDRVNAIVPQLIEGVQGPVPVLGVSFVATSYARRWGVERGVLVGEIAQDSSAARSGLRPTNIDRMRRVTLGDVIARIDGTRVDDRADVRRVLARYEPGDTVELTLLRAGEPVEVDITLMAPSLFR